MRWTAGFSQTSILTPIVFVNRGLVADRLRQPGTLSRPTSSVGILKPAIFDSWEPETDSLRQSGNSGTDRLRQSGPGGRSPVATGNLESNRLRQLVTRSRQPAAVGNPWIAIAILGLSLLKIAKPHATAWTLFFIPGKPQASLGFPGIKKSPDARQGFAALSDLARIQTWNLLSRNQVLYSVELRGLYFATVKSR